MPESVHLSDTKRKLLEKYLRGEIMRAATDSDDVARRSLGEPVPLSLAQEQVWRRAQETRGMPPLYNESITIHRTGSLDLEALQRGFAEIIRRHESWRTTFDTFAGGPVQVIQREVSAVSLPVMDLRRLPEAKRVEEALRIATEDARRPFDLKHGPLVRAKLVQLGNQEHRLFLTMHQLIVDGISVFELLPLELTSLYEAFAAGKPSPLPELPFQFGDFARWQRHWLQGAVLANQLGFWRKQLAGELPVLRWPNDRSRPALQTFRGAIKPFTMPKLLTEALRKLSRQEGVSLFAVLLAGFSVLLRCYSGQDDIIVGTLAPAGRKRSEFQRLLGYFLNPVPLRSDLSGNPTFSELLRRVQRVAYGALSNDDVPLEHLARDLGIEPDPRCHPFFQVVISLAPAVPPLSSGWDVTPMDVESGGARWDLYLELNDRPTGMIVRAQYNPDLFEFSTIDKLLEDLQALLEVASSQPYLHLSQLPFQQ